MKKEDSTEEVKLKDYTREKLEAEINTFEDMINGPICCYGMKDLLWLDALYVEANLRRYEIIKCTNIKLIEPDEE